MDSLATLLRGEAERLAREAHLAFADAADKMDEFPGFVASWGDTTEAYRQALVAAHLALLTDLSRPASRDALVRLCIAREQAACSAEWEAKCAGTALPDHTLRRWIGGDHRDIALKWHALRDDLEALERAALNTFGATNP